jgi:hypothetical protein
MPRASTAKALRSSESGYALVVRAAVGGVGVDA